MTSNIEILKGVAGFVTQPSDKTSMLVRILLNGVCDVNGEPLLKLSFGRELTARLSFRPSFRIRAGAGFSSLQRALRKQNADEHL